jgi:hypothetical protein
MLHDPTQQAPVQTPATPPLFPRTRLDVVQEGVVIITELAPGLQVSQFIPEDTMNAIAGRWLETRKQIKHNLEIVRDNKFIKSN